ncbi:MAG TPA: STAS domain-containing protein [Gemmataceae bacterium]|nr:STAS domain-containing protein [Gemmataceae bacterium]
MATQQGSVRVCKDCHTVTFQVVGWGRMHQSMPVRRLSEQFLAEGIASVQVDLRHCTYLDSTFLGTLLTLKRASKKCRQAQFVLVSPSPECCRLFKQMGVEDCLPAITAPEPAGDWTELPCEPEDVDTFNRNVIQAHQELANLGGPAGAAFQAVARCLEKDCQEK